MIGLYFLKKHSIVTSSYILSVLSTAWRFAVQENFIDIISIACVWIVENHAIIEEMLEHSKLNNTDLQEVIIFSSDLLLKNWLLFITDLNKKYTKLSKEEERKCTEHSMEVHSWDWFICGSDSFSFIPKPRFKDRPSEESEFLGHKYWIIESINSIPTIFVK